MKPLLTLLAPLALALGIALPASGQIAATFCRPVTDGDSIDKVQLTAVYRMTYHFDPSDTATLVTDEVWLEIGKKMSKQYSRIMCDLDLKSEDGSVLLNTNEHVLPIVVYTGLPSADEVTVDYRLPLRAPVMRYTEKRPRLDWQLGEERREIAGKECQVATCDFGGRHWTAWFAPDLPYPYGPYKLGGLPGLILELYDGEDDYHYTCIGFRMNGEPKMLEWKWDQKETTKEQLQKLVRSLYANTEATMKALGVSAKFGGDPMLDLPYNPIER